MQERRTNLARSTETRAALIAAARAVFVERGYAAAGTPEVVERAGLTRGALYHHFADKQALFDAVVRDEAEQVAAEIGGGSVGAATPLAALGAGSRAYFRAMEREGRTRLLLVEGPAVLGPERMRAIDRETGGRELREGVRAVLGTDVANEQVDALSDLVSAMFDRAVLAGACGGDRAPYEAAITALLAKIAMIARRDGGVDGGG
jgi:AcrR family transcriptional regulator